ncbi:hypothetical protein AVEN_234460-1 [Araneus ventricosus]|uniref:Uncharacterized protein n=1 Tax=Araneus ventricosus TaxID=182803 RepID=A0A4Y2A8N6_ARAVE|nr:hypothetical protein AVEN_234460-1 [Araneus ventricosus]
MGQKTTSGKNSADFFKDLIKNFEKDHLEDEIVGEVREKINKIAKFVYLQTNQQQIFEQHVKSGSTENKKMRNEIAGHFIDLTDLVRKFSNDLKNLRFELYQANENAVNKDILVLKTKIKDLETRNKVLESKLTE